MEDGIRSILQGVRLYPKKKKKKKKNWNKKKKTQTNKKINKATYKWVKTDEFQEVVTPNFS